MRAQIGASGKGPDGGDRARSSGSYSDVSITFYELPVVLGGAPEVRHPAGARQPASRRYHSIASGSSRLIHASLLAL
jgi:hypothetical protein